MKNLKSVLALIMALCLMMCLAVPAFATETTTATTEATGATADTSATTEATGEPNTTPASEPAPTDEHGHEILSTGDIHEEEAKPESGFVKVLRVVLLVLEVISSVALIIVVLLQSGKEAGLSGALSGNNDSYLSKSGKGNLDKTLASATKWIALAWIVITLILALI